MEGRRSKSPTGGAGGRISTGYGSWCAPDQETDNILMTGDDRPYFDMRGLDIPDFESNEVCLPHNTNYLKALSQLESRETKVGQP